MCHKVDTWLLQGHYCVNYKVVTRLLQGLLQGCYNGCYNPVTKVVLSIWAVPIIIFPSVPLIIGHLCLRKIEALIVRSLCTK
jgi:hypothetical protein